MYPPRTCVRSTGGLPRRVPPAYVIICVGDVWFFGIAAGDGWWQGAMSPVQLPHLDSLRFVYGRGNTTVTLLAPSFSCPGPGSSPCQGHEGGTPFPGADGPHRATGVHPF
jgi:hypothetical protein